MAGFLIAMISGALMSTQGVFNTDVTKSTSIWVAAGFVQLTALITCIIMWFANGRPEILGLFQIERKYALLGGVMGAFITYTVVKSMSSLGIAKASLIIVITQIAAAYLIELFGIFGSKKIAFSWMKFLGLAIAIVGVVIYNLCGNQAEG
ncbi:DMT family transporter [[Clostridium] fimetarium]|uniref:Transporter family-2 protein n=1 Tax=[Clostridium] fimetarium TaxID=99656 RepID=A0A1I0MRI5_9FIRM|nr:DMT family transporter [[Clostridium] fimetarium]SEV90712.1 transporter family-2 protein [[Clostridium] fimetarium]